MDIYRTGEDGLVPVTELQPGDGPELEDALLRGEGLALPGDDVFVVGRRETEAAGAFGVVGLDRAGDLVVLELTHGRVGSDVVTLALEDASDAAALTADSLQERFEAFRDEEADLLAAHADYYDREAELDADAVNVDQRLVLLGTEFSEGAVSVADYLSGKDLGVRCVRFTAYDTGNESEFLLQFDPLSASPSAATPDAAAEPTEGDAAGTESGTEPEAESVEEGVEPESDAGTDAGSAGESAQSTDGDAGADGDEGAAESEGPTETEDGADAEPVDTDAVLEAVRDGVLQRLAGTFDGRIEDVTAVEHGTEELLLRPDHPAYAGGVMRYRVAPEFAGDDDRVTFEVDIYGGSEAEKEQLREVVRSNADAVEEELDYEVKEGADGVTRTVPFAADDAEIDETVVAAIVEEFERLVGFFHPRVMGAWRETAEPAE